MTERNTLVVQLYQEYKNLMFVVAFHILKDKDSAEDAVQTTIEKILLKPEMFHELKSDKIKSYIASTTRNTALDMYRKRSTCQEREIHLEDINRIPTIEITTPKESELDFPFNQLYDSYREILHLKYECGYTLKEIGDILGITEANAKKRVSRARKQLKRILKTGTVVVLCIATLTMTGVAINAATGGKFFAAIKEFFETEIVTEESQDLTRTEIIYDSPIPQKEGASTAKTSFKNSHVVSSCADGAFIPVAVTEIKTTKDLVSDLTLPASASVIFYQNDFKGWNCKPGDTLTFQFSKYEDNYENPHKLIVGYVQNGIMYAGQRFQNINGCYQLAIQEDGEYYIYLYNMNSNELTIESGKISIE